MLKHASLVALFALAASAQAPVAPTGPRLVMVDVSVLNGKDPLKDLKKEDFVLEDKGKKQTVAVLEVADPDKKGPAVKGTIASNRMTAKGEPITSATVVVFDRLNTPSSEQAFIRRQLLDMLTKLNPTDRVGVFSLGLGLIQVRDYNEEVGPLVDVAKALQQGGNTLPDNFTAEQQALYKILAEATTPIQEQQNQTRVNITFPAFRMLARHMAGLPGRKNLMWITGSFPLTYGNTTVPNNDDTGQKNIGVDKSQNTGNERRTNDEAEIGTFTRVLYESGVALFPVQTGGAGASFAAAPKNGTTLTGAQTFEGLAQNTGGKAFLNANDITPLLREVLSLPAYTYSLGFYPDEKGFDDRDHALKVTLVKSPTNDKAKLSHRKAYYAWTVKGGAAAILKPALQEVMDEPTMESGIGLMAVANPQGGAQALDLRIDANDLRFVQQGGEWTAAFDVALAADGSRGGALETFTPKLTTEQLTQALKEGLAIRKNLDTGNGNGIIRIAVQDKNTGVAGSIRLRYAAQ